MGSIDWNVFMLVGLGNMVLDIFWTLAIKNISTGKKFLGSMFSCLITLVMGLVIVEYVSNRWYLVSAVIGAFLGTYISMWLSERFKVKIS